MCGVIRGVIRDLRAERAAWNRPDDGCERDALPASVALGHPHPGRGGEWRRARRAGVNHNSFETTQQGMFKRKEPTWEEECSRE